MARMAVTTMAGQPARRERRKSSIVLFCHTCTCMQVQVLRGAFFAMKQSPRIRGLLRSLGLDTPDEHGLLDQRPLATTLCK
jgi:hypothetical protein